MVSDLDSETYLGATANFSGLKFSLSLFLKYVFIYFGCSGS